MEVHRRKEIAGMTPLKILIFNDYTSAALLSGAISGGIYSVFGWLEIPEVNGFLLIDYILVAWFISCLVICATIGIAERSIKKSFIGVGCGIIIYYSTRWGFESLDGEPKNAFFRLSLSLLETGAFVGLSFALISKNLQSIISATFWGLCGGGLYAVAHVPYLFIATTTASENWIDNLIIWSVCLWVTTPILTILPSAAVQCKKVQE
jgi:hypothetical protein